VSAPAHDPRHVASLAAGLVAASISAILVKLCVSEAPVIAFYRLLGAGAVFLLFELLRKRSIRVEARDVAIAAISAFFLALHFYFWIRSLFMTSINSSMMLLSAQPLFALILQPLVLRSPIRPRNLLSLLIGMAGIAVITGGDLHVSALAGRGDLFALFSAAMAACYLMTGSFRRSPLIPYLGVMYSLSGLMLLTFSLVTRGALTPARPIDWLWILLIVIFPTLIGHTLLNRAMAHFPSYLVNLSVLTEPVLTAILAWFVFRAVVTPPVWLGGALIVGAVVVEFTQRDRASMPPPTGDDVLPAG
jgi:drug/metabolite transporter (DMT)-like permease